ADHHCFAGSKHQQLTRRRATGTDQRLFRAATACTRRGDNRRQRRRQRGARDAEKDEQHLRVRGIAASGPQRRPQVVSDQHATSASRLEVAGGGGCFGVGGRRIRGQGVV